MESQATVVYPLENGQVEVHSSSQHPTETQHVVAYALGIDYSQVVCIVKRMGGGFGGCAITLVKKGSETAIKDKFTKFYANQFGIELKIYDVKISNGTSLYKENQNEKI